MGIFIIILLFIAVLIIGEIVRELHCFKLTHYTVQSTKLTGIEDSKRIVFLSDLHNYCYGRNNEKLFQAIEGEHPDLILIGGDMLLRSNGNYYGNTVDFLVRLPKICEVYYANGNHEQKLKEWPEKYEQSYTDYKAQLVKSGIHFLENESKEFLWNGKSIRITGLEIPLKGYERFTRKRLLPEEIEAKIGRPCADYEILLAHHPAYIETYQKWGADLILAGHYHGGVIQIPGIGGVIAPDLTLFPRYSGGCYQVNSAAAVVSRGIGVHSVPIRLWNPAEIVSIELV